MQGFTSPQQAQCFLSAYSPIANISARDGIDCPRLPTVKRCGSDARVGLK